MGLCIRYEEGGVRGGGGVSGVLLRDGEGEIDMHPGDYGCFMWRRW